MSNKRLHRILDGIISFFENIKLYGSLALFGLLIFFLYEVFWKTPIENRPLSYFDTPYSLGLGHYKELNGMGICKTYREFVFDYVNHKKSTRRKLIQYNKVYKYYTTRDISSKSVQMLNNASYGHLFNDLKVEMDKMPIVFMDKKNRYTDAFVASNVVEQGRFFLDVYTSGNTQASEDQVKLFSNLEYVRCVKPEKYASLIDKITYRVKNLI